MSAAAATDRAPPRANIAPHRQITVAMVRSGTKYGPEYVERLVAGVRRNLTIPHRFILITDQPETFDGVKNIKAPVGLPAWWTKMALFAPWNRGSGNCLYIDLDNVLVGKIDPMVFAATPHEFAICRNFTRLAGNHNFPCAYGSCAMFFAEGWGADVWSRFSDRRDQLMHECGHHGDQLAIERLVGKDAFLFQRHLPREFFLGYRDLGGHPTAPPPDAAMIVFGGSHKPHNCTTRWVKEAWTR